MNGRRRCGLSSDLWHEVNRAAYAVAQAGFARERAHLVAVALEMLQSGRTPAQVSEVLKRRERDPTNLRFDY